MNKITEEFNIGGGLLEKTEDLRDFPFGALYGRAKLEDIPDEFVVAEPLRIKDQKKTDYCTGYALTAVSEDQEGVELSPEFQFAMTKRISGDPDKWGASLRDACKSAVKFGSLAQSEAVFTVDGPRDKLTWHEEWPEDLIDDAMEHRKESFFDVDDDEGPYDRFDNIRSALWINRHDKKTILTGVKWEKKWTVAIKGVINEIYNSPTFGHAFKFYGVKLVESDFGGERGRDTEMYIMAQLSNGKEIGDEGIFYFSRAIINGMFKYGNYTFKDIEPEKVKYLLKNGLKANENKSVSLTNSILSFLKKLFS